MDLPTRGEGPPTGVLIDIGDSYQPPGAGQHGVFNAEEAIAEVFGSSFRKPAADVPFSSPYGSPLVPQPLPAHIYYPRGGSQESKRHTDSSWTRQGDVTARTDAAPQSSASGSFGNDQHAAPSVSSPMPPFQPHRRGFGEGFGGPISDSSPSNRLDRPLMGSLGGFGRAPPSGEFGVSAAPTRTGFRSDDRDAAVGGSCSGSISTSSGGVSGAPKTEDDPLLSRGFGRTNEYIARLPARFRSGRGTGRGSGSKRSGRRGLFVPPSDSPAFASPVTTSREDPFEESSKRPPTFGDRPLLYEAPHKRRRVSCGRCGRPGHEAEVCHSKPKEQLRCYNCNRLGHLAVRCTHRQLRGGPRSPANGANQVEDAEDATQEAVDLVCALMRNREVRVDLERANTVLHDNILEYMLQHVKL